jgi:hypothetical protein
MNADTDNRSVKPVTVSKGRLWTGRILSALPVLLLLMSSVMDLMKPDFVVKAMVQQGFPDGVIVPLGITILICTILYAVPRTAILGAVLLTGYLGGAVATHVRAGDPLFSHILAPVYFAVILWIGLYLREPRLSALVPLRS